MSLRRITQRPIVFNGNNTLLPDDPPKKKSKTVNIGGINFLQSEVIDSYPEENTLMDIKKGAKSRDINLVEIGKYNHWTVETIFGTFEFDDHNAEFLWKNPEDVKNASIMSGTIINANIDKYIGTDKSDKLHLKNTYIEETYTAGDSKKDVFYLDKNSEINEFRPHRHMDAFDEIKHEE